MTAADLPSPPGPVAESPASRAAADFLLQAACRAFSLAAWLVAARIAVLFFRPMDWTAWLLPGAVALSVVATVLALAVTFVARRRPDQHAEARNAALASATLLVISFAWSLVSSLF